MIRTLLAGLTVVSLLLCVGVLVVKWRSLHGHVDEYTLGPPGKTQTRFTSSNNNVLIETIQPEGTSIYSKAKAYPFGNFVAGTLMLPSLFAATEVRRLIRRRMRRGMPEPLPTLPPMAGNGRPRRAGRRR